MKNSIVYPFPTLEVSGEEIAQFVRDVFVGEFGEEKLLDMELETYPNEYAIDLVVSKKDEKVSEFISQLRGLFVDRGLSVLLLARER